MSHARRHEKKEWIKTVEKLCNKGLSTKERNTLEKILMSHEQKFHEYALVWSQNEEHKLHRRKLLNDNETLVDTFSEIWLLFSKYIVGDVMSKEGYMSLKTRIHYAMIPLRGSDIREMEDRCIEADWKIDSAVFSPLNNTNFQDMMFDTLEGWIDMEHDKNYVSAFAFSLFLTIADITHSPLALRRVRVR